MRKLRWVGGLALLGAALLGGAAVRSGETPRVEVKEVKYAELGDIVRQNRGKVVVVDFWATNCGPCKQEFPHLVELHRKYANDGLVAVSVSVDDLKRDPTVRGRVLNFLQKQQATFTNVILDEPAEVWQTKFNSLTIPIVYVFGRDGRWTQFKDGAKYTETIAPLVVELLKKK
jgi:thiol-disulfide isomerase/thioredoxin